MFSTLDGSHIKSQGDMEDQLSEIIRLANMLGMYDAADYIARLVSSDKTRIETSDKTRIETDRKNSIQDSATCGIKNP